MDIIYKLLLVLWYVGYSENIENINVSGRVTDFNRGAPLANTKIVLVSYASEGPDNEKRVEKDIVTDERGYYKGNFEVGYRLVITADIDGYYPARNAVKLNGNHTPVLDLQVEKLEPEDKLIINEESSIIDKDNTAPYTGYKVYYDRSTKKLYNDSVKIIGYDFINSRQTEDTLNADLWCTFPDTLDFPQVLIANKRGGIIPIFYNEIRSMLEFEKRIAPETGYVKEYIRNEGEAGYFVKCRDGKTYVKPFLEGMVSKSAGYYRQYGLEFKYFYQPDGTRNFRYYKKMERMDLIHGF